MSPGKSFIAMLLGLIAAIWGVVCVTDYACRQSAANHERGPAMPAASVPVASQTWPHKMANINAGRILPESDPTVSQFTDCITVIRRVYPEKTEEQVCDGLVFTWQQLKPKHPDVSLLIVSKQMALLAAKR